MTAIWFCSDLHIGHSLVAGLRGYETADEHDAALAANWDRIVRPTDQVWVLGDVVGRRGHERYGLDWIAQRHGTKHLVAGNHDACHPMHSKAHKELRRWLEVFETVQQTATMRIAGQRVILSHFPYRDDPDGDHTPVIRHAEWRMPDTGQWLLHGHTHSDIQVRGRQVHVGVDAHDLRPIPLTWIAETITKGTPNVHA